MAPPRDANKQIVPGSHIFFKALQIFFIGPLYILHLIFQLLICRPPDVQRLHLFISADFTVLVQLTPPPRSAFNQSALKWMHLHLSTVYCGLRNGSVELYSPRSISPISSSSLNNNQIYSGFTVCTAYWGDAPNL